MLEILFTCGQVACLAGYLFGAYVVVAHAARRVAPEAAARKPLASDAEIDDSVYLRRYLALDA